MRRIENFLGLILSTLFLYSFVEVLFIVSDCLKSSPTYFIPFRINFFILGMGTLISGIFGMIFPLWNVGKYLKTNNIPTISKFTNAYKVDFIALFIGYLGLVLWYGSKQIFSVLWWMGTVLIIWYLLYLFIFPFYTNNKNEK